MLERASQKLQQITPRSKASIKLKLDHRNPFDPTLDPEEIPIPPQDAIISTLVLEHIPLPVFFSTLSDLLVPGGMALVTNMHADMGRQSQAGFVNEKGVKVRGESFVYSVEETVREAERQGFEVSDVREREVREEDLVGGVVGERGRKWVGCRVWYGLVCVKRDEVDSE